MTFEAEIKEVKSRTTTSNDKEFRIVMVTDNEKANDLGLVPPLTAVKVKIEVIGD